MATYKLNKNIVLGKCTNCNHYDKLQIVQNKNLKSMFKGRKNTLKQGSRDETKVNKKARNM